ncbi:MAG: competence/damage-inducible protein A [Actinobacteria bacterium]|nr:competence/damage-inducible protein A [Actinomycetota bacterium]
MRAEVICVGTELLLGDIINSNASYIGRELATAGIECYRHVAVGDNEERIAAAIAQAMQDADAVIISGGLGPTQDDITREAVCHATGQKMVVDDAMIEAIKKRFSRLKRHMPASNLRQADRPEHALPIEPLIGTAPGLIVPHGDKVLYLVPGVPGEMKEMLARAVMPDLTARAGTPGAIVSRVVRVTGMAESAIAESLALLWNDLELSAVKLAFLAGGGEVRIRLTARDDASGAASAALDKAEERVRGALGSAVVGTNEQTLEAVVFGLLTDQGMTVACAESLTGGLLGARLSDGAGASGHFRGSIVAYMTEVKASVLGVPQEILEAHGAVSKECALAMASAARAVLEADVGVAATGVAGPGKQEGVDVGTVHVAVEGPRGPVHREVHLPGDRGTIRMMAATAALNLLRLYLMGEAT